MAPRMVIFAALGALLVGMPPALVSAQEVAQDHKHPPADSAAPATAPGLDLDALAKRMTAASGPAKIEAMANLLNALVAHQKDMCGPMMANMKSGKMMESKGHTPDASDKK